jgi:S-adenosylmethionine:tRNA ribosyltransferase-isomerase
MHPAPAPRGQHAATRLLHLALQSGGIAHRTVADLPELLSPGDLLVVNDAATLPASLQGSVGPENTPIELRLLALDADGSWRAVLFGRGDWTTPTERRPSPPELRIGAQLRLGELTATVKEVLPPSPRLLRVRFTSEGAAFWSALYRSGRPVQYAYVERPLELWDVQTTYAARPWAVEAPSAGFPLSASLLLALRARGVAIASVTHAAGLSASGDEALDLALPLEERFEVPARTVELIHQTKAVAGRVVAAGTTVVRALEGRALQAGRLTAGTGSTTLKLGPGYRCQVVTGLLTGMHDPSGSHYSLLSAFAPRALLDAAWAEAEAEGYLEHEFGDVCLIL